MLAGIVRNKFNEHDEGERGHQAHWDQDHEPQGPTTALIPYAEDEECTSRTTGRDHYQGDLITPRTGPRRAPEARVRRAPGREGGNGQGDDDRGEREEDGAAERVRGNWSLRGARKLLSVGAVTGVQGRARYSAGIL